MDSVGSEDGKLSNRNAQAQDTVERRKLTTRPPTRCPFTWSVKPWPQPSKNSSRAYPNTTSTIVKKMHIDQRTGRASTLPRNVREERYDERANPVPDAAGTGWES